jgi:hypothetical protein
MYVMADDNSRHASPVNRRNVLKGIGAGAIGAVGVTGTAAATGDEIWIVSSEDFDYPWHIADKMRDYAEEIFYSSSWTVNLDSGYDMSGAPTDDDGTYTKECGGDSSVTGLQDWFENDASYADDGGDCQLLMVPKDLYGGGCGGGRTAVAGVAKALWELEGPDSGSKNALIGNSDNGDTAFGEKAASISRCLQEMGHTWGAGHADGHIWTNNYVNRHSPLMMGDGQENNCGYDVNHCGWCDDRFLEGFSDCAAANIPHNVMDYSESQMEDI